MPSDAARSGDRSDHPGQANQRPESRRGMLAWTLTTSGLLLGGGALRVFGSPTRRPEDLTAVAPFSLEAIPRQLDGWKVFGDDAHLDKVTTRITGSTDHIIRNYIDEQTGTTLSVLILYGPAEPVLPHTPQVCYPASGYRSLADPVDRTIQIDDRLGAVFRTALFSKSGGRTVIRQAVYHSYRLDGVWSPVVSDRSLPRRFAGLFKVQIGRRVLDGERIGEDEPIDAFLRQLLPAMEKMIAASTNDASRSAVVVPSTSPAAPAR